MPAAAQMTAHDDTLFLATFDLQVQPDYALGEPSIATRGCRWLPDGGKFGGGLLMPEGSRLEIVGNDGNFPVAEGTIEFWIKPSWLGDDSENRTIFTATLGENEYLRVNTLGRGRLGLALAAGSGDAWTWRRTDGDASAWQPNTWHHVAVTWGDGQMTTFLDAIAGRRPVEDATMPDKAPESIIWTGCDAVVDGLRFSGRRYSASDVRQAIAEATDPPYRYVDVLPKTIDGRVWVGGLRLLGDLHIPLLLDNHQYGRGFAAADGSRISLARPKSLTNLTARVGLSDLAPAEATCRFEVRGDGRQLLETGALTPSSPSVEIALDVSGCKRLELITRGENCRPGDVIWANVALGRSNARPPELADAVSGEQVDMIRRQVSANDYLFSEQVASPCVVATHSWIEDLDPSTAPSPADVNAPLSILATPGEYEPASFVIYAADDLGDVRVRITDLTGRSGTIPADAVDVRLVLRALMRDVYTVPPERSTVVPRFLLPNQPIDIPAGTLRQYHLTVHVPDEQPGGEYAGHVLIRSPDMTDHRIPFKARVLPFHLDSPAPKHYGMYYRFPSSSDDWSHLDRELDDIRCHGANTLKSNLGVYYVRDGDQVVPHLDRLRHGLRLLRSHGYHGPLPVGSGAETAARLLGYDPVADDGDVEATRRFHRVVRNGMEALVALGGEYPEFEFLPTHMDEVFGHDRLPRYIRLTEAVRQIPSLRVYITMHNDPKRDVSAMMRLCDPFVDVRCYNGHCMDNWIQAGNTFADLRRELDRSGDEAWLYHNIRGSFFPAEWMRLVNGFYMWNSPLMLHTPWMYYSYHDNPMDATDGPRLKGGDFAYAVPHPDNPKQMIPTRHWEAYREGVDDARYLATLQNLIDAAPDSPEAQRATVWLRRLRAEVTPSHEVLQAIEKESPLLVALAAMFDDAAYRGFRAEIAGLILDLRQSLEANPRQPAKVNP